MTGSLYQRVLGARFDTLDAPVRTLHSLRGHQRLAGRCTISGAQSLGGRLIAAIVGLPRAAASTDFTFEIKVDEGGETWTRRFPGRAMRSHLSAGTEGLLVERLGLTRLQFRLVDNDGRLSMQLASVHVAGLPWPRAWLPEVWAHEHGGDGRFHFDVGARFGRLGLLVAYRGEIDVTDAECIA